MAVLSLGHRLELRGAPDLLLLFYTLEGKGNIPEKGSAGVRPLTVHPWARGSNQGDGLGDCHSA